MSNILARKEFKQEHREKLGDYYKFIKSCGECRKPYGTDWKAEGNFVCPVCEYQKGMRVISSWRKKDVSL
jgi:hypothetical protein